MLKLLHFGEGKMIKNVQESVTYRLNFPSGATQNRHFFVELIIRVSRGPPP